MGASETVGKAVAKVAIEVAKTVEEKNKEAIQKMEIQKSLSRISDVVNKSIIKETEADAQKATMQAALTRITKKIFNSTMRGIVNDDYMDKYTSIVNKLILLSDKPDMESLYQADRKKIRITKKLIKTYRYNVYAEIEQIENMYTEKCRLCFMQIHQNKNYEILIKDYINLLNIDDNNRICKEHTELLWDELINKEMKYIHNNFLNLKRFFKRYISKNNKWFKKQCINNTYEQFKKDIIITFNVLSVCDNSKVNKICTHMLRNINSFIKEEFDLPMNDGMEKLFEYTVKSFDVSEKIYYELALSDSVLNIFNETF